MKRLSIVLAVTMPFVAYAEDLGSFVLRDHTLKCMTNRDADSGQLSGRCVNDIIAIEFTSSCAPKWIGANGKDGFTFVYNVLTSEFSIPKGNFFTGLKLSDCPVNEKWAEPTTFLLDNGGLCQVAKFIPTTKDWVDAEPQEKVNGGYRFTGKHIVDFDGRIIGYHCNVMNWIPYRTCEGQSEIFTLHVYDNPAMNFNGDIGIKTFRHLINLFTSYP